MVDIVRLTEELTQDPLGRGYSAMTDQQIADDLNNPRIDVIRGKLSGSTLFNAIDPAEFAALSDQTKQFVRDVFSLGDAVDVGPGTNARTVMLDAFGAATTTRANLVAAVTVTLSRAEQLNLLGRSKEVGPAHVAKARA